MTGAGGPAAPRPPVLVGMLGLGVVGSGVAQTLNEQRERLEEQAGCPVLLHRVAVRDLSKPRTPAIAHGQLSDDPAAVLDDPAIAVVIELMGGEEPALSYIKRALANGKHVITANKEVMAKHGPELAALAAERGLALHYEASVGGGIPLIAPFRQSLLANRISALHAIINGTTNYMLTRMAKEGVEFSPVLAEAQRLGYAEPDPSYDVEGTDAAFKLAILAGLAFHTRVAPEQVYREGITKLSARDFRYARELGYAIKLLAIAKRVDGAVEVRVHPAFIAEDRLLGQVDGVFNAVEVDGDLTGRIMFYGRGAGSLPTTSAVVADLIEVAQALGHGGRPRPAVAGDAGLRVQPMDEVVTRYYARMTLRDQPGVLAQIAQALGDLQISIASVIQKESDPAAQVAEIVLMTHLAREDSMQAALARVRLLPGVVDIGAVIRVED
ncbi:MAG: homoserine dehydrogenase [Chloroflexota bacterium]